MSVFDNVLLWIKVLHIVAIVCWMAMFFYLPRLFVYHAKYKDNAEFVKIVQIQESKLYKVIGTPALAISLLSGALLVAQNPAYIQVAQSGLWLHIKLLAVIALIAYHIACGYFIRSFAKNACQKSHRFFRIFNEIPTILLIIIVILAVFKPAFI